MSKKFNAEAEFNKLRAAKKSWEKVSLHQKNVFLADLFVKKWRSQLVHEVKATEFTMAQNHAEADERFNNIFNEVKDLYNKSLPAAKKQFKQIKGEYKKLDMTMPVSTKAKPTFLPKTTTLSPAIKFIALSTVLQMNTQRVREILNQETPAGRHSTERDILTKPQTWAGSQISSWIKSARVVPTKQGKYTLSITTESGTYDFGEMPTSIADFYQRFSTWKPGNGLGRWLWNTVWQYKRVTGGAGGVYAGFEIDKEFKTRYSKKASDRMRAKNKQSRLILPVFRMKSNEPKTYAQQFKAYKRRVKTYERRATAGAFRL